MGFGTDSRIVRTVITGFFVLAIAYGMYEAQGLAYGPSITIERNSFATHENPIRIEGETARISELRLNGARVSVTETGAFSEPYLLAPGSNHIVLEARDARGRTDTEELSIYFTGEATPMRESEEMPGSPAQATTTPQM